MKRILPLTICAFLLTGCGLLFNRQGKTSSESSKPGTSTSSQVISSQQPSNPNSSSSTTSSGISDNGLLLSAIVFMNTKNYHMTYSLNTSYTGYPEEYEDLFEDVTDGPYEYDVDGNYVHVYNNKSINQYFDCSNGYDKTIRYYQNDGVWKSDTVDLTTEPTQIKYFDQMEHDAGDYALYTESGQEHLFRMKQAKENELGFESLYLKTEPKNNTSEAGRIIIDTSVKRDDSSLGFTVTSRAHLHAELYDFLNIHVTMPQAYNN